MGNDQFVWPHVYTTRLKRADLWQRKNNTQRAAGWLEEETIEQCDSPQDKQDNDTREDIIIDFDECQSPRSVDSELNIEEVEERRPKYDGYASYMKINEQPHNDQEREISSSSCHLPLEVWRERGTGTPDTVSSKRMIQTERKTILYGQTPAAMCQNAGAREFAELVLAGDTQEHLQLLRQYHTPCLPQLSQLFDELDVCALSVNPLKQKISRRISLDDSTEIANRANTASGRNIGRAKQNKSNKQIPVASTSRENRTLKKTSVVQTVDMTNCKRVNCVQETRKKGFDTASREVIKSAITVIPETESDTSSNSESDSELSVSDFIPPSPSSNENQLALVNTVKLPVYTKIHINTNSCSLLLSAPSASNSPERSTLNDVNSVERQQNRAFENLAQQTNTVCNSDYNKVLDEILFEDESLTQQLKTNKFLEEQIVGSNLKYCNPLEKMNKDFNFLSGKADLCKNNVGITKKNSRHYNTVLDTLMFGDCSSPSASQPEQNGETSISISQTPPSITISQDNSSNKFSDHSTRIIDELFGSLPEKLDEEHNGKVEERPGAVEVQRRQRPSTLSTVLNGSPWASLGT
nr:uncharacterized protein LOC128694538 [Cherax quadricarinatus]